MTLDDLLEENTEVLRRMKEEDDIARQAFDYWNWDKEPRDPAAVAQYIREHPNDFRGAVPQ